MFSKFKILAIILFIVVFLSNCTTTSYMGMIGTRNIDYSATYEKGNMTQAEGEVALFLIIPFKLDDLYAMEIIDQALEKGGYDFMTDVTVTSFVFPTYIYNSFSYEIKGTGWRKVDANKIK